MVDIARLAGVSVATVSRALADSPRVTAETRERVEAAVRQTGYAVNPLARGLRRQEARQILVLVPDIGNPFFSEVLLGIEEGAAALGFSMLVGNTAKDPVREDRHAVQLLTGAVDGMILLNGRLPPCLQRDRRHHGRIVAVSEAIPGGALPVVGIDNAGAGAAAVAHLAGRGHRRIAHVAGPAANILTGQRLDGYRAGLRTAGLAEDPALIRSGDFTIPSGESAMAALLALAHPPTAVFCSNDEMAIGTIRALRAAGRDAPRDMAVIGFDDIQFAGTYEPPLTTIRQPRRRMGAEAAALLGRRIAGEPGAGGDVTLPFALIERRSSAGDVLAPPPPLLSY
jgi:LacI family repressor for deo operon, udp, cdd, tsx, nupC, and nupG